MPALDYVAMFTTMTFLLAGLVKGVVGMGLPTVAIGLLAEVMAPAHAAALLLVPSLITNVWQLIAGPNCRALLRRLWPMLLGIAAGSWLGSGWLAHDQGGRATVALGAALVAYAVLGLANIKLAVPSAWEPWLSAPVGVVTGMVTAATGVFVIPAVPYLSAIGLEKDQLVQALGLSFTASTLALGGSLFYDGALQASLGASFLALIPALIGMFVGQRLRDRVRPAIFRRYFFLGLLGLGADQVARRLL
jgi:uncharacterized membrane protein YfcA